MTQELEEQIKVVAEARKDKEYHDRKKANLYKQWEDTHYLMLEHVKMLGVSLSESEAKLRELTIEVYNQTAEKKPAAGVGIVMAILILPRLLPLVSPATATMKLTPGSHIKRRKMLSLPPGLRMKLSFSLTTPKANTGWQFRQSARRT